MSEATACVYVEVAGVSRLAGHLYARPARRKPTASFVYAAEWLDAADHFALDPALTVAPGPHYAEPGRTLFGAIGDSAPDRWGQTLLRRAERRRAKDEGRMPRALGEVDFVLGVTDTVRQGALRFSAAEGGPFLAPEQPGGVPSLVILPRLVAAAERFLTDEESAEDLRLLLAPGSSLGGARPKASVRATDGTLMIAKFPKPDDEYRLVAWEAVALRLAARAGIPVAAHSLEAVAERDVLLLRRFDRRGVARVPFLSGMSMLGAIDGESRTYPELADAIRRHGAAPRADLTDLWRRIVFTVLISNTDDHLRNHGFLYEGPAGWRLSPAYDLNPMPADIKPRVLTTAISIDEDPTASLELAFEVVELFDLKADEARRIAAEVALVVARWRDVAAELRIAAREIERMASAFEHDDLRAALR